MDGATDSDHSMTWEDFFGSTTDLTPTLIGIYDSLLEPDKSLRPEADPLETAKDARNDPPVSNQTHIMTDKTKEEVNNTNVSRSPPKDPSKIIGGVKLPIATLNKSSLYSIRTNSDNNGASESNNRDLPSSDNVLVKDHKLQRTFKETKQTSETTAFDNLSPNVKRMISSASETTTLKFQKKTVSTLRTSTRHRCNIPLVGATSKISQSVEIYDQPSGLKNIPKAASEDNYESPSKITPIKAEFRIETDQTYDIPTNNRPAIYDVPNSNKNAFESLSLPYIDQSIELSITSNDREFDTKLSSKECSPQKPEPRSSLEASPAKSPKFLNVGTNSLHRRNLIPAKETVQNQLMKTGPYPEAIGSTGNLKSCAVPEKEAPRLNPPIVEVTRPLSMSSIASSSSTSSSGVQNKGGVNSAYLASIESLDDHSDVDMTSANGSNNFVNNAGILNASVSEGCSENLPHQQTLDEMSGLSQLERVCAEIVQTEKVYVEDLRQVVEGYLHVWRRDATFSDDELSELFNNIEDIYAFNRSLCEELNTCRLDATCIARCFVNNTAGFAVYTSYCTGYPRTMERLAALASKPQSAREFRERQMELQHPLPLASYLLKPVQRILKYHLLLQNVVKQCASPETEYALLKMTGIAQHIDDMKRRHEHAVRVQEIQSLLYGWNGPDLTTYGELCAEGTFRVFGAKAMRHAFLFDKMLLVTKNREDGILAYKSHIMCNNMMLVESIAGAPLSFHVIPWDAPRAQLTLQARSPRHKREWTLLLKRVILENYNAVIPSHARQLVMELGQNKTDDDMLAEKSHNLITQASMRKQLSAPEYLEKRKLERERRKSFENGIRGRLKKGNRKYTLPNSRSETVECDCAQVSAEKGIDYTCDNCYIDICSDCETEISNKDKVRERQCDCVDTKTGDKCPECDRSLHYIDSGSAEHLERKQIPCKCPDFKSSQESFSKEYPGSSLNKTRGYHSSDNIIGYTDSRTSKDDLSDTNNSLSSVRNITKTCLKCTKIKENIPVTDSLQTLHTRRSRCVDVDRLKTENLRSKSKDDPQRSKLSKIGTWRRKSEPGLQQNNIGFLIKKSQDSDIDKNDSRGNEKIEFECRSCGSNKISRKNKTSDGSVVSDLEGESKKKGVATGIKSNLEIKMYNTKNIPKKISKIKKNRAKGFRVTSDTSRFYTDFSTDVSTENILHITESNDSLNVDKQSDSNDKLKVPDTISKDEDIDEETYKRLIEKTDSFKKNELEKVKYLHKQKVINETSEIEDKASEIEQDQEEIVGSCEDTEQPLEQIISQLLLENREFQKLLKKQQQRNSAQRRHQRLLKSHSNPDQVILSRNFDSPKMIPKYTRQTLENLETHTNNEESDSLIEAKQETVSDDDHIYETLRVESRADERLHSLNSKSKIIQHSTHAPRPKRLPSPPNMNPTEVRNITESDYVYLSFNKQSQIEDDGIYDVPVKSPQKVKSTNESEYYVTMEKKGPPLNEDLLYDNLIEVCRRKKEVPSNLPCEYLPMGPEQQSPNTPEIWLSRQKEHFNVSRDRKSGSLPRSFQVPTSGPDENNLSSFKCKPNGSSKTYLNRDGKVMSTDRPFTIASDQSELSYDDVENYMSENDIFKFCKVSKSNDPDYSQNISQSTLELEEEIDRCYKNNFEKLDMDANKNDTTNLQTNLNTSTTSSCEVLPIERDDKKDNEVIHPEHKIYKPTANVLSLKNVLSRFKSRNLNKSNEESEINANDQSNSETSNKSPTNEKRSALNPRSYSRNLLQRFRSIIGDEPDDIQAKYDLKTKLSEELQNTTKSDIKVVITTTDADSTTTIDSTHDVLSKSMHEGTTMTESQKEKNQLETFSHSCDDLVQKTDKLRPSYSKSISMVTSTSSSVNSSPLRSNNNSHQNLNKLPIYMQGSKHLGARIAQSDYVDPTTLSNERSTLKAVNVLINKNAVRPDSLFSNSSFVTSSSESTYQEPQSKQNQVKTTDPKHTSESSTQVNSDESFYEKSFEKIEHFTDEDVFRDSAVYSDQEDIDETKESSEEKIVNKTIKRIESLKREASIQSKKVIITTSTSEKTCTNSNVTITTNKIKETIQNTRRQEVKPIKPKIAPPVPVKPKIGTISQTTALKSKEIEKSEQISETNKLTVKRNVHTKTYLSRSESSPTSENLRRIAKEKSSEQETKDGDQNSKDDFKSISNKLNQQGNIQLKRLSFERASLDSATRKIKLQTENRSSETPKIASKTVLERRMELEMMTKTQAKSNPGLKKPYNKPKSITTKVASFERSVSENHRELKITPSSSTEKANIPFNRNSVEQTDISDDLKGSWVKQVVNKFQ